MTSNTVYSGRQAMAYAKSIFVCSFLMLIFPVLIRAVIINGNFENGMTGWTVTTHYVSSTALSINSIGDQLPYAVTTSPAVAPYSTNTTTGAFLNDVYSGNYSAKLFSGYGEDERVDWARIQQTASVPDGYCYLEVYLAMVLPGYHLTQGQPNDDPYVEFDVFNSITGATLYTKTYRFGDPSLQPLLVDGNTTTASGGPFKFLPWTRILIDLTQFSGQTITIAFTANKCAQQQHFSYAYLDNVSFLPCNTPTVTKTVTPTKTPTNTITRTFTPTYTPTFTVTNTQTFTVTKTSTPTFTPTFTVTDTPTFTATKTFTPTFTPTFTVTDTPTFTATKTFTPTFTPTFTMTFTVTDSPTLTPTISKTITPTVTATPTFTDTNTFTPTFTATPTFTMTFTQTDTRTCTPTFTSTPTFTMTFTQTATPTFSPTFTDTNTVTDTPTFTMTFTDTFTYSATKTNTPTFTSTFTSTATPTYTCTFTYTNTPTSTRTMTVTNTPPPSPTITPTPLKAGYLVSIKVYNEAGEVVRTIAILPTYNPIADIITSINGATGATAIGYGGIMNILLPGVGLNGADVNITWDAKTDGGQYTASGAYTIRVGQVDTYNRYTDTVIPITVIRNETYIQMDVYNSAGELVRQVTNYDFVMPPDFTPGPADIGVKMDIPSLVISNKGDPNTVQLRFGSGVEEYMLWDGKNNFGAAVSSGVYEVKIVIKTETLLITVATGSVTVLKQDSVIMTGLKVVPNPFDGTGPGVELRWETGVTGDVTMYIYNIKGELVRATRGRLEATKLMWDTKTAMGGPASNGIYIAVLQGVSYDGNRGSMKAKVAVNRRTGQ